MSPAALLSVLVRIAGLEGAAGRVLGLWGRVASGLLDRDSGQGRDARGGSPVAGTGAAVSYLTLLTLRWL